MKTRYYFLGGSSPDGFRSSFGSIISDTSYRTYIIKGGPGTGKSTLMKRIASEFSENEDIDVYYCSSDPDSYDAVVLKGHRVIFADGTAPHVFDPEYPGAVQEILNLGGYWRSDILHSRKNEIIDSTAEYLRFHKRCRHYISAVSSICTDTMQIAEPALKLQKLDGFIARLSKKIFPKQHGEFTCGKVIFKQLSAVTPNGIMNMIPDDNVYLLNDRYAVGSDYFLRQLTDKAISSGLDVEVSLCSIYKDEIYEHIRIPSIGAAFMTSGALNEIMLDKKNVINFMRFYDAGVIAAKKSRLKFNSSAASEILGEAFLALRSAKAAHDILEQFYIGAIDFERIGSLTEEIIQKIKHE